jgi:hypothetical protein
MRPCPLCESKGREKRWRQSFLVPDGWTQPAYLDWFVCRSCGFIYGDNPDITQADYTTYYKERYGFGVEDEAARQRQQLAAQWASHAITDKNAVIVDFGGAGIITQYLRDYGFCNCADVGAGDPLPDDVTVMFAEHVLEHIYDLPKAMHAISKAVKVSGMLIVDGPESAGIAETHASPLLDFHQKHINHFSLFDYMSLMHKYGFEFMGASNYIERGNPCIHIVFGRVEQGRILDASIKHIQPNVDAIVEKLKALGDRPVIVWGCGDIALHVLSLHMPNVIFFIDKDPAFKGAVIGEKNVLTEYAIKPDEHYPIVVIAQNQRDAILENIRKDGLTNEVIVI